MEFLSKKILVSLVILSSVPMTASAGSYYRCVIFDSSIEAQRADQKVVVIKQDGGSDKAEYVSKNVVLDFDFKESPMRVLAHHPNANQNIEFTKTIEKTDKYHGYISDLEIEINCKKRSI